MAHNKIPPRWLHCPRRGQPVAGKFLPLKTMLGPRYDSQVAEENRFHPSMLSNYLKSLKVKMGLLVDLTNTTRFYDRNDIEKEGIKYIKLQCKGHGECPTAENTDTFIRLCERFNEKNPPELIGVHCTHGFNRTGFLICAFLVEKMDWRRKSMKHFLQLHRQLRRLSLVYDITDLSYIETATLAIMRSFSLLQEAIIPYIPTLITQLTQKLLAVSKNPSKPHFNHYMFEAICLSIRITCKANPAAVVNFEEALFMVFTEILQNDVQEFIPYVFQVMSLLLETHKNGIPSSYMALFPHLLQPVLWERAGNIPPLVRLLQAFLEKGSNTIASAAADKIPGLLGVFQKLIASKANDHQGFFLLNSIIEHMPPESVDQYRKQIFILLFQRLQNSKTTKFIKSFLVFINLYCIKYGALALQEIFDSIQPKMFGMVLEKIIIPEIQKVSGQVEKKICAVGITKLLTECPPMMDTEYTKLWTPLLQSLIGLFELPEDDTIPDEEHFIDIEDTPGYQTAFSQLAFAGKKEHDPVGQLVNNPKIHLAQSLHKLSTACPGRVPSMVSTSLNAEALQYLQGYLQAASVTLL